MVSGWFWSLFRSTSGDEPCAKNRDSDPDSQSKIANRKSQTPSLSAEESLDGIHRRLPLHAGARFEKWNVFRAELNAVAGLAAVGDATFAHERFQPLLFEGCAGGMFIEEAHLADHGRADEFIA